MVHIPGGVFKPPIDASGDSRGPVPVKVAPFELDVYPVTNAQYLSFVRSQPDWRRSKVARVFADAGYLKNWSDDLELGLSAPSLSPVVSVSWFAARAFCEAEGNRLPTIAQWEFVASQSTRSPVERAKILRWYEKPNQAVPGPVGSTFRNAYGVYDLFGLVWEWTDDFNSSLAAAQGKSFCGGGAAGAKDPKDYAAFMRYAFRSSLSGNYTVGDLGFRCAQAQQSHPPGEP